MLQTKINIIAIQLNALMQAGKCFLVILSIDGEIYFIINLYKKGITTAPASFNELTRKHYDKYFFPVTKTDRYALINQKSLVRRCLLIDTKEHIILTPCVDLFFILFDYFFFQKRVKTNI